MTITPLNLFRTPRHKLPHPLIVRPSDDYAREGGRYGASRDVDRPHVGIDLWAPPGTLVTAPWDCEFTRTGFAYRNDRRYRLIVLEPAHCDGEYFKLLYVSPISDLAGTTVGKGTVVGRVQDLSERFPADRDHPSGMVNHIHVERWKYQYGRWDRTDPTEWVMGSMPPTVEMV